MPIAMPIRQRASLDKLSPPAAFSFAGHFGKPCIEI
jgi:hypothetical protein